VIGLLVLLAIGISLVWVGFDASDRDFSQCDNWYWRSAFGWVVACAILWIAYFPLYLSARNKVPLKSQQTPVVAPPSSTVDELAKLAELRDSGALTQDEFDTQKAEVILRGSAANRA
jgi:hypothetical protein